MEGVINDDAEIAEFKQRSVLALSVEDEGASSYVAEELNRRGWSAENRSVSGENNFVLKEDLMFIGSIVFDSPETQKAFESDKDLMDLVNKNGIKIYTLNLEQDLPDAEADEDNVFDNEIARELDGKGFKQYKNKED